MDAAEFYYTLFDGVSTISMIDSERVLKLLEGKGLITGLNVGDIMPAGTVIREAVRTGKRVTKIMPAHQSKFSYRYIAIGVPILQSRRIM